MSTPPAPQQRLHDLKCWPGFYKHLLTGEKTFEIRKDDRGFRAGDVLWLREWDREGGYSGREMKRQVSYLLAGQPWLAKDYVAMALAPFAVSETAPTPAAGATPETDALVEIDRLFRYLAHVQADAPRNSIDPYQHEGGYSFSDLRAIRDHARQLERQRDEARARLRAWQNSADCVGIACRAKGLLARAETAEAELDSAKRDAENAVLAEREVCAQTAMAYGTGHGPMVAAAIRARTGGKV